MEALLTHITWGIWSLGLAIAIRLILGRFALVPGALLAWFMAFVLMWLVVGNMAVLPFSILPYAVPLSLLEVFVAALILKKMTVRQN